jgi:hypothetical protein
MALGRRYSIVGKVAAVSSSFKTALVLVATAAVRPTIYDFSVGTSGTPADNSSQWELQRFTAPGSSTAVVPAALDSGDPTGTATAGNQHTTEPTYTSNTIVFGPLDLNIRATYRWVAAPGGELICPATAASESLRCRVPTRALRIASSTIGSSLCFSGRKATGSSLIPMHKRLLSTTPSPVHTATAL